MIKEDDITKLDLHYRLQDLETKMESLTPVLLGPDSGRKVAEHIELFGKSEQLPDPRDEAVGLLREAVALWELEGGHFLKADSPTIVRIRALLARIDK